MVWSGGWEGLQQCKVAEGEDRAPFPFPHPPQASSACRALAGPLLFTNIDVGVGSYATFSTGPRTSGPSSQSNTTYWNVRRCWPVCSCLSLACLCVCRSRTSSQPPPASASKQAHVLLQLIFNRCEPTAGRAHRRPAAALQHQARRAARQQWRLAGQLPVRAGHEPDWHPPQVHTGALPAAAAAAAAAVPGRSSTSGAAIASLPLSR